MCWMNKLSLLGLVYPTRCNKKYRSNAEPCTLRLALQKRRSRTSVLGWYSTAPRFPQADLSASHSERPENAQISSTG
jgi:hypothetical protein